MSESQEAAGDLLSQIYDQLRRIAAQRMQAERPGHTLQATALVHEAWAKIAASGTCFESKTAFLRSAAEAMRRILIDHARGKLREKRGGRAPRGMTIEVADLAADADPAEIVAFDDALHRLESEAADAAEIVRLRFYAGSSIEETAEALGVSPRTVNRGWTFARAWLYRELET